MRVPKSPHSLKKMMSSGKSDEDSDSDRDRPLNKPPVPSFTSNRKERKYSDVVEPVFAPKKEDSKEEESMFNFLAPDGVKLQTGFHRSRERTRRSAVLRLLERKQAQKEKEKEREQRRSCRAKSSDPLSSANFLRDANSARSSLRDEFVRERSWARRSYSASEDSYDGIGWSDVKRRHLSRERTEVTTKTYINIGPGKPTRIREHSPSKIPSPEPEVTSNGSAVLTDPIKKVVRDSSPSKKSGAFFQSASPLRSAGLLKDIPTVATATTTTVKTEIGPNRKRSFTTEKTIIISNDYSRYRRMSTDVSSATDTPATTSNSSKTSSPNSSTRSSTERDFSSFRPNSSRSSSFSSTSSLSSSSGNESSSCESNSSRGVGDDNLSKRRISLEERFKARSSRTRLSTSPEKSPSPEDDSLSSGFSSASSRLLYNLSSEYRYHRAAASARTAAASAKSSFPQRERKYSHDHSRRQRRPASPVRKISLPPTCYEAPERRRWDKNWEYRMALSSGQSVGGGGRFISGDWTDSSSSDHFPPLHASSSSSSPPSSFPPTNSSTTNSKYVNKPFSGDSGLGLQYKRQSSFPKSPAKRDFLVAVSPDSDHFSVRSSSSSENSFDSQDRKRSINFRFRDSYNEVEAVVDAAGQSEEKSATASASMHAMKDWQSSQREKLVNSFLTRNEKWSENRKVSSSSSARFPTTVYPRNSFVSHVQPEAHQDHHHSSVAMGESDQDELQSVTSTVSGSGMDFFRKFVQRKQQQKTKEGSCKECENRFRREVLIDRLVSDSLLSTSTSSSVSQNLAKTKTSWPEGEGDCNACSSADESQVQLRLPRGRPQLPQVHRTSQDDFGTLSTRSSFTLSTVSGSGLRFLRNYLKKKKKPKKESEESTPLLFNTVPVPFPPINAFYGPAYPSDDDRQSLGSTIADLLEESFDSEDDSELKNLDWAQDEEEFGEDFYCDFFAPSAGVSNHAKNAFWDDVSEEKKGTDEANIFPPRGTSCPRSSPRNGMRRRSAKCKYLKVECGPRKRKLSS